MKKRTSMFKVFLFMGILSLLVQPVFVQASSVQENTDHIYITNEAGKDVEFVIEDNLSSLFELDELEELVNDHPEAERITIHNVFEVDAAALNSQPDNQPDMIVIIPGPRNIRKKITQTNAIIGSTFVTSVARGATKKFTFGKTFKFKSSASGELSPLDLSLTAEGVRSYKATYIFTGPPHDSKYNATNYYIRWRGNKGTYTAEVFDVRYPNSWRPVRGSFNEVVRGYDYSVNTNN
ncbi:hypothetical protein [Xylanivirga thermophila]|jgi:hypothetical protein|uniref:hypothetical protein n=1 Tax=Xylanivirga thermophila TaxID=2496273 RepID=UPI00101BDD19|nr:hypothetical protein [Xylanivirga thermophila]